MDFTRQRDWFDPSKVNASATIVGCGGIGSFTALALAKLGVQRMALQDYDAVEEHNVPNQMFFPDQVGENKVDALAETVERIDPPNGSNVGIDVRTDVFPLQHGIVLSDVVISALDSMEARAALWEQVKYKVPVKLFLDGRLGGQHIVLYAVNPISPDDIAGYEATLHSDDEGLDLPCTGRSIIDVGFAVASLMTRAVRLYYGREQLPAVTYLNQQTLDIFKGGWS